MKKVCIACGKEWYDGEPACEGDESLVSSGICSDHCRVMLELWTFSGTKESLREYMKRKEAEHENLHRTSPSS